MVLAFNFYFVKYIQNKCENENRYFHSREQKKYMGDTEWKVKECILKRDIGIHHFYQVFIHIKKHTYHAQKKKAFASTDNTGN